MTNSGKVDRSALPAPAPERPNLETMFVAPEDAEEQFLVDLWSELLKIENVGIEDHFLNLGGDSLFAVQVIARVWDYYDVELPVASLFEYPTIRELAGLIRAQIARAAAANA
jgi:acyl carrier protein